jgi:hypothetical protein
MRTGSRFGRKAPAEVDRLAGIATGAGAQNVEGPGWEDETYYAVEVRPLLGSLFLDRRTKPLS